MRYNRNFNQEQFLESKSAKIFVSNHFLQLESVKQESRVIANQQSSGEKVLELCTNRPSRSGRKFASNG
jgi:hypothetical protein